MYLKSKFQDGSNSTERVIEKESILGRRFDPAKSSPSGDHYIIDDDGNLLLMDLDGLINVAMKSVCS